MFVEDLVLQQPYTKERYGSVRKVYIVCTEDHAIVDKFQRWMVEQPGGRGEGDRGGPRRDALQARRAGALPHRRRRQVRLVDDAISSCMLLLVG